MPAVQPRVFSPLIDNWVELDAFLRGAIINANVVLEDDETAQSAGAGAQDRARGRIAAYDQVRREIAHLVEQERDERSRDWLDPSDGSSHDPSLGAGASVEAYRG